MKLVLAEAESDALRGYLTERPGIASCALLRTEAVRAVRDLGPDRIEHARRLLRHVRLVTLADDLLDVAGALEPAIMRSLDPIHLAAALSLGDDLDAVVTYDDRMIEGAGLLGLSVASPS